MVQLLTLTFLMYIITLFLSFIPVPSPNHSQGLVISSPATESHLLHWLATFLHYLFTGLWVLPVFWISKPINVIWFQDIASAALNESQKLKKTKSQQSSSSQSVSQSISRFIADLLFSILLQLLFLLQAMVVGLIPGVGGLLSLLHMTILYSFYCFEYKWMHDGNIYDQHL
jgi:etoposide-induced 2.4 mRNA